MGDNFFPSFEHLNIPKYQKIRNIFFKRYLDIKEHCRTYILYFNRLRTPSVVQSNTDDKGRFVVGQTVVPEHNLQASRAKKRKQASVQAVYNQCYKQATKNQDKVFICSQRCCIGWLELTGYQISCLTESATKIRKTLYNSGISQKNAVKEPDRGQRSLGRLTN